MHHTVSGVIGEISTVEKSTGTEKSDGRLRTLSDSCDRYFEYCQGPYIDIGIDFHQLCGETVALINTLRP